MIHKDWTVPDISTALVTLESQGIVKRKQFNHSECGIP